MRQAIRNNKGSKKTIKSYQEGGKVNKRTIKKVGRKIKRAEKKRSKNKSEPNTNYVDWVNKTKIVDPPKKQRGGDARNNNLIAYFNDLEASRNRRDPGMQGDVQPPVQPKVVEEPKGNTTLHDNIKYPEGRKVPVRFKKGGSWEGLGKADKPKKRKYKKDKKTKPNRKGLY